MRTRQDPVVCFPKAANFSPKPEVGGYSFIQRNWLPGCFSATCKAESRLGFAESGLIER